MSFSRTQVMLGPVNQCAARLQMKVEPELRNLAQRNNHGSQRTHAMHCKEAGHGYSYFTFERYLSLDRSVG